MGRSLLIGLRASCLVFNDLGDGKWRAMNKIHLFDAQVDDAHGHTASPDTFEAGGPGGHRGHAPAPGTGRFLYDNLRFPELFRAVCVTKALTGYGLPSALPGKRENAHWHALIRARAIENQLIRSGGRARRHNSSQRAPTATV